MICEFLSLNQKISSLFENLEKAVNNMKVQNRNVNRLYENIKILLSQINSNNIINHNNNNNSNLNNCWNTINKQCMNSTSSKYNKISIIKIYNYRNNNSNSNNNNNNKQNLKTKIDPYTQEISILVSLKMIYMIFSDYDQQSIFKKHARLFFPYAKEQENLKDSHF